MAKPTQQKKCSICNKPYKGFGNNAEPVNKGRCCDRCNVKKVIPARLENYLDTGKCAPNCVVCSKHKKV